MGPCYYCGQMIWHTGMAERGYHSKCRLEHVALNQRRLAQEDRHVREHERRRLRRAAKRIKEKADRRQHAKG